MAQPHAYVQRMIVNEHLSWRRRLLRSQPSDDLEQHSTDVPDSSDQHAERDAMIARLGRLPHRQRAAVVLRYYVGLTDAEIAPEARAPPEPAKRFRVCDPARMAEPTSVASKRAGGYDVGAIALVRLVRLGRELRFIWRAALFGCLLWGAFVLTVERSTPEGSAQWNRVDADASPGFITLLVVAGAAFVTQISLWLCGRTGKVAALLVPPLGPGAPTHALSGADHVVGLLAALRRRAYVGFGVITAFLVITAILVAAVIGVWPAFEGSRGEGGRVVTIGRDATFSSFRSPVSGRGGGGTVNRIHTSSGDADAVGNTPHDGERWTIVHDPLGGADSAYLVGGHAYLLYALIGLALLLIDLAIAGYALAGIRSERRARRNDDVVSLADSIGALAAGARATLAVGTDRVGYRGRRLPPVTVVIGSS